jgi:hypothetical protein
MLESRSKFLVCKIDPLWNQIFQSDLLSKVRFDKDRLLENFVTIIIHFDQLDVKCNYYGYLCDLTDKLPAVLEQSAVCHQFMDWLMVYNLQTVVQLKELYVQLKNKQIVEKSIIIKTELLVNLFLRIMSNCAFACKINTQVATYL